MAGEWIAAAAAAASTVANTAQQAKSNRKGRRLVREENQKARDFALADWNRTNHYNSPAEQMKRFKDAGLNPNLIYGQSNTADAVTPYKANAYEEKAPQFDTSSVQSGIESYYDTRLKSQTIENAAVQNQMLQAQIDEIRARTANTLQSTLGQQFDLNYKSDLRATNIESTQAALKKIYAEIAGSQANTQFTLSENERKQALQASSVEQAAANVLSTRMGIELTREQIAKIKVEVNKLKTEGLISEKHLEMWQKGVNPNAGGVERMLQFIYEKVFGGSSLTPEQVETYKRNKPKNNTVTGNPNKPFYK